MARPQSGAALSALRRRRHRGRPRPGSTPPAGRQGPGRSVRFPSGWTAALRGALPRYISASEVAFSNQSGTRQRPRHNGGAPYHLVFAPFSSITSLARSSWLMQMVSKAPPCSLSQLTHRRRRADRQWRRAVKRGAPPSKKPCRARGSGRAPGAPRLVMRQVRTVRQVRKARRVRQAREARHAPSAPSAPGAPSARGAPDAPTATEMPGALRGTPSAPSAPNATGAPRRRGRARCVMARHVHHVSWVRRARNARARHGRPLRQAGRARWAREVRRSRGPRRQARRGGGGRECIPTKQN